MALVFAEPSTRTRMSFQVAAARLGIRTLSLDNPNIASLSKGETLEDTFHNIAAMLFVPVPRNSKPSAIFPVGEMMTNPDPHGPGFPEHAPSVYAIHSETGADDA